MNERKNDFIELTDECGLKILINMSQITVIEKADYNNCESLVNVVNAGKLVKETYEEIKAMMEDKP